MKRPILLSGKHTKIITVFLLLWFPFEVVGANAGTNIIEVFLQESPQKPENSLSRSLHRAREAYSGFHLDVAILSLKRGLDSFDRASSPGKDSVFLLEVHLLLAELFLAKGMLKEAGEEFLVAARKAPFLHLDTRKYSPKISAHFSAAQKEARKKRMCLVDFSRTPVGSRVFWNGIPVSLKKELTVPAGTHHLWVKTSAGRETFVRLSVHENTRLVVHDEKPPVREEAPVSKKEPLGETEQQKKRFWKKPVFWIVTGAIAGAGTGLGLALSRQGNATTEGTVTVSGPTP